jgi:mono/diheme cytochrome c family protein
MRFDIFGAILLVTCIVNACSSEPAPSQSDIERGKYLVTFGGCHDCHTPKIPGSNRVPVLDTTKLLAGHPENAPVPSWSPEEIERKGVVASTNSSLAAWAGPWGVSFAINLTPEKATGIGEWSESNFIQMARAGKHQGPAERARYLAAHAVVQHEGSHGCRPEGGVGVFEKSAADKESGAAADRAGG